MNIHMHIHVYIYISIYGKVGFRECDLIMWVLGIAFHKLTGPLLAIYTTDHIQRDMSKHLISGTRPCPWDFKVNDIC